MSDREVLDALEAHGWQPLDVAGAERVFCLVEAAALGAGASPKAAARLGVRAALRVLRGQP